MKDELARRIVCALLARQMLANDGRPIGQDAGFGEPAFLEDWPRHLGQHAGQGADSAALGLVHAVAWLRSVAAIQGSVIVAAHHG